MSGFEGDGDKGQGRAHARPLLFLCSSAGSSKEARNYSKKLFIYFLLHYFFYILFCDIFISITTIFVFLFSR